MITIYYGMCGTFKLTTLTSEKHINDFKLLSDIKPFTDLRRDLFEGTFDMNDLTLAACRLMRYSYIKTDLPNVAIERGITDYCHCHNQRQGSVKLDSHIITNLVDKELSLLLNLDKGDIKKVLMIMNDTDFIKNTILLEPHRLDTYHDIDNYLYQQEDYVKFTKLYNDIEEVIDITDAMSYLKTINKA